MLSYLPTFTAVFLASLVEFVEALAVLLMLPALFGESLTLLPLRLVQLAIGALLLLSGLRWRCWRWPVWGSCCIGR